MQDSKNHSRPLTGYNLFISQYFADHPKLTFKEVMKLGSREWKAMADQEKQPYLEKAKQLKPAFKQQNATNATKAHSVLPSIQEKSSIFFLDPNPGQLKAGCTGWHKYLKTQLPIVKNNNRIQPKDRVAHIAEMWHRLGDYERKSWE